MDMQICLRRWRRAGLWLVALTLCGGVLSAQAQQVSATGAGNPPDRVARVSYVAGEVGLLPHGVKQWQDVDVNRPLTTGDRLSTSAGARLELEFGDAALRLAGNTAFGFLELGDWQTRMSLTNGTLQLSVHTLPDGEDYEIDTPQVAVVVDRPARVRVDLGTGNATTVSVRQGTAVVYGEDGARQVVTAGRRYRFNDAALDDVVAMASENHDAFYRWCRSRDQMFADSDSGQYVSAGTVGYRDLDYYGQWQPEVGDGQVWFPDDVGPDWVPYRHGHWASVAPWGWTWISDAPWGFAPFHYGRWGVFGGRWGWIPGPANVPAVYAPALVTFVGGNGWQVSVDFGVAPVGWYPLQPGMIYNPWYRVNREYYWRINHDVRHHHHKHWKKRVDAAYNVWRKPVRAGRAHYLGKHPPYGITVVSHKVLAEGRDVRKSGLLHVDHQFMRRAPVRFHGVHARPITPKRALLHASVVRRLPVKDFARPVVAHRRRLVVASDKTRTVHAHTSWPTSVRMPGRASDARHAAPRPPRRLRPIVSPSSRVGHASGRVATSRHGHARPVARRLPMVPRLRAAAARTFTPIEARDPHPPTRSALSRQRALVSKRIRSRRMRRLKVPSSGKLGSASVPAKWRRTLPPVRATAGPDRQVRPSIARRWPSPLHRPAGHFSPTSRALRFRADSRRARPVVTRRSSSSRTDRSMPKPVRVAPAMRSHAGGHHARTRHDVVRRHAGHAARFKKH